jgi:nicotinamidase-related amidase
VLLPAGRIIDVMTTALLVIDVQESFRARPADWANVSAPDIADRVDLLVARARERGDKVVWILHTEPDSDTVFDPRNGHVRVLEPLAPRGTEPILYKTSHNAFTTTNLAQYLTVEGIDHVVVTGIRTEQCCETTARVASDLGYRVTFVLDATATVPLPRWDGRGVLDPDEVMARTASALHGRFAEVVLSEQLLRQ